VIAHVGMMIEDLEARAGHAELNDLINRLRADFAEVDYVMNVLDARSRVEQMLGSPAEPLSAEYYLNSPEWHLEDLRGSVVLLDFFAHWCGPCITAFPYLRELRERHGNDGLVIVGVSGLYGYFRGERGLKPDEEIARMRDLFVPEYELDWPLVFASGDMNTANYGVRALPTKILIDRQGIVRYFQAGPGDRDAFEALLEELLSGSP
jgi:thiol-disulfide isomerase/thioredoxin